MFRSLHSKKIISLAACAAVIFSLASCGNTNVMSEILSELGTPKETAGDVNISVTETTKTEASDNIQTTTAEPTDEAGGNPEESSVIEITVMEDKYIYDNHEISFDELLGIFDSLTGNDVVQFHDENAALDTYQKAVSALEEREIQYINDEN